jgi:lipoprotein
MRKNLVVIAAIVTAVVLATGCGQKATARKTPEATPIETTCDRADAPTNKGYALVGTGQTVGSDHAEYLSEYAGEFDLDAYEATKPTPKAETLKLTHKSEEPEATKPHEIPETSNTPKEVEPVAGVPQYENPLPPASASVDFESVLKGMGATEIDIITRSKAMGNTSLVARFGNGIVADFYFDTPVSGQGIALTSFSVYAADDAFSLTGESDYGMSSWSMSYDIDNAGARDLYYVLSPSDRYFSDTDHGKEKLLLPMEISDLLDKDVAPYLQVKDVSLESEPKI